MSPKEDLYIAELLGLYRSAPQGSLRVRSADRDLARSLFIRNVPLDIVDAALLLAAARRAHRPSTAPPLQPVRSLHYYLPVIEELLAAPPPPGYAAYLRSKLASTLATAGRPAGA